MTRKFTSDVTQAGLLELVLGVCLLTLALAVSVSAGEGAGRNLLVSASPVFLAVLFCGFLLVKRYVIDPKGIKLVDVRPTRPILLFFGMYAIYSATNAVGLDRVAGFVGPPLFLAVLISGAFLLAGQGRRQFYAYAGTALVSAGLVSALGIGGTTGAVWVALVTAGALLVGGGWMLAGFVRRTSLIG